MTKWARIRRRKERKKVESESEERQKAEELTRDESQTDLPSENNNLKINAFQWWHNYLSNVLSIKLGENLISRSGDNQPRKSWILRILK